MSYRGILTTHAHALAGAWAAALDATGAGIVVGRDVEPSADEATALVEALAAAGHDVCDLGLASPDEVSYVADALGLPAVHLAAAGALGIRPGAGAVPLAEPRGTLPEGPADAALHRPGVVSSDDLTDDYVAHLRQLAPLHGTRPVRVALHATGTALATAPLALASPSTTIVADGQPADLSLLVDGEHHRLVVRDEQGRPLAAAELARLLAHHGRSGATRLFGVPSPLLLARTVVGIVGRNPAPLSSLVRDAAAHQDTVLLDLARFDEAAKAVADALAALGPRRLVGEGLRLAGTLAGRGEWALSLHRAPGPGSARLVVQAADAPLRAALREDAEAILGPFVRAA